MQRYLLVCLLYLTGVATYYICKTDFNILSVSESQGERRSNKLSLLETKLSNSLFLPKLCKQMFLFLQVNFFRIFLELFLKEIKNPPPLRYFSHLLSRWGSAGMLSCCLIIICTYTFIPLFPHKTGLVLPFVWFVAKILEVIFGDGGKMQKLLVVLVGLFPTGVNHPILSDHLMNYR